MLSHPITNKKVPELIILKSLAFLSVVFQSSLIFIMNNKNPPIEQAIMIGMFFNFVKFSAPAFIFLAGFSITQNYYKHFVYRDYLYHKSKEILLPYFFWTFIYLLCLQPMIFKEGTISEIFLSFLTGTSAPHLWYVVMVFQFHLLTPLLFLLVPYVHKWLQKKQTFFLFLMTITTIYTLFMWLSQNIFSHSHSLWLQYTDRSFLAYSFYFILGGVAALSLHKWRKVVVRLTAPLIILYLGMFGRIGYELLSFSDLTTIHLSATTYLKPTMFFYIVIELILLYGLAMIIAERKTFLRRILFFIGQFTYSAYLSHFFFLFVISNFIPLNGTVLNALFLFGCTTLFSVLFASSLHLVTHGRFPYHAKNLPVKMKLAITSIKKF